jgi:ATP-binding cassette subfamily B protein
MPEPKEPMRRLFVYLQRYQRKSLFAISASITNKVLDLMPPIMVGWAVDVLARQAPAWIPQATGTDDPWANSLLIGAIIVLVFGLESLTEWMLKHGFLTLAQDVQHDLRLEAYQHLQHREIAYFENNRTGNLMAILNDDINQLERFLNDSFNQILQLLVLFVFAAIAFLSISWQLTLMGMLPVPFIIWGSVYYQRKLSPRYVQVRKAVGQLSSRLENNISGILVIKSFTAEKFEFNRVKEVSASYKQANFSAIRYTALYSPLIRILITIGFAGGMVLGAYQIIQQPGSLTIGELTLFAMMVQRFLWPITRLGNVFDDYERARASARRVFGLMDSPNPIREPDSPKPFTNIRGEITFRNVSFRYQQEVPLVEGLDFQVKSGQTIGIAGPTGGGKTTLIKLLLRLYEVNQGQILIDGVDIRDISVHSLRRNIALVSQDVYLFHGTISENIAYGLEDCSQEAIESAAEKAQLHQFILSLPRGYQTIVGERGIKLSGGQRQRLSIARAILKNAPILVLDEATSAVDTETEQAIQQNLSILALGRTALIVAHRLSTIRHADQIMVVKDGKIVEKGGHDQLLGQQGIYADLWKVQVGEI